MIHVLPIVQIIRWVAVVYAVVCGLLFGAIVWMRGSETSIGAAASLALSGSGILNFLLIVLFNVGWRKIWRWIPKLNRWIYPDLTGTWKMEIHLRGKVDPIYANVFVRQRMQRISMDVSAPQSTSTTLATIPKKDAQSGLPQLYYVFLVTTRPEPDKPSEIYQGAAVLTVDGSNNAEVTGNYWTSKETSGWYRLYDQQESAEAAAGSPA